MASVYIPHTFSNNTVANATEVNAVIAALKNFVETETVQRDGSVKAGASAIDYTTVPRITVSANEPTVGVKAGDVWVQI